MCCSNLGIAFQNICLILSFLFLCPSLFHWYPRCHDVPFHCTFLPLDQTNRVLHSLDLTKLNCLHVHSFWASRSPQCPPLPTCEQSIAELPLCFNSTHWDTLLLSDSKFGFVFVDSRVNCLSASSGRMSINFWILNAARKVHPSCSSYFLTNSSSSWIRSDTSAIFLALPMDSPLRSRACAPVTNWGEDCTPGRVFAKRSVHHLACRSLQSFSQFRWSSLIDRQKWLGWMCWRCRIPSPLLRIWFELLLRSHVPSPWPTIPEEFHTHQHTVLIDTVLNFLPTLESRSSAYRRRCLEWCPCRTDGVPWAFASESLLLRSALWSLPLLWPPMHCCLPATWGFWSAR